MKKKNPSLISFEKCSFYLYSSQRGFLDQQDFYNWNSSQGFLKGRIFLHGYGAPAHDLLDVAISISEVADISQSDEEKSEVFSFCLEAPLEIPYAYGGRAWFPISDEWLRERTKNPLKAFTEGKIPQEETLMFELKIFQTLLKNCGFKDLDLMGFSQGGMVILHWLMNLLDDFHIKNILLFSTSLIDQAGLESKLLVNQASFKKNTTKVFVTHGIADEVLPYGAGVQLETWLKENFLDTSWFPFSGGHEISREILYKISAMLAK